MKLEELQYEAREDLAIKDQERLDQESFKNQNIKPKWLEYRSRYDQLLIMSKTNHQRLWRNKWEYYGGKAVAKINTNALDTPARNLIKINMIMSLLKAINKVVNSEIITAVKKKSFTLFLNIGRMVMREPNK